MCDPTTATLAALSIAGSAMQMQQQQKAAKAQAAIARQQALDEYEAARKRTEAEYAEANRQIGKKQIEEIEEKSDVIREANEQLGTLQAAETALTEGSLGNLFFEKDYEFSASLVRISEQTDDFIDQARSKKDGASQGYANAVTVAKNNAQNTLMRTNAASNAAALQFASTAVSTGVGAYRHSQTISALKGTQPSAVSSGTSWNNRGELTP